MRLWFRDLRKSIGITQEEIAKMINENTDIKISRSMIGHIETGKATPSVETAMNIAKVLKFNNFGIDWTKFYEEI